MALRKFVRRSHSGHLRLEPLEPRCLLAADALFQMRLEVVDMEGNPVEQVAVGEEFELRMLAKDLRTIPSAKGLFCAYADIVYRDSHVMPIGGADSVMFPGEFTFGKNVDLSQPGLIDEVGATAGITPTGLDEVLVVSVRFEASTAGTARFGLNPTENQLHHPILAYGLNYVSSDTSAADTAFLGTSLRIVGSQGEVIPDDGWMPADDLVEHKPKSVPVSRPTEPEIEPPTEIPTITVDYPVGDVIMPPIEADGEMIVALPYGRWDSTVIYATLAIGNTDSGFANVSFGNVLAIPGIQATEPAERELDAIRSQRDLVFSTSQSSDLTPTAGDRLLTEPGRFTHGFT